jgi:hypothetical protein
LLGNVLVGCAAQSERMWAFACGFAGRRLQPLGYVEMDWHRTTESNREPSALETAALPVELARHGWWVRMDCSPQSASLPRTR